jgi:hypothetical protein
MSTMLGQFGIVDEVTYGTPVTVTRFYETDGLPDFDRDQGFTQSTGLRQGDRGERIDRGTSYIKGVAGPVKMDVPTKGFGIWLKHMLGTIATGGVVDSNFTHTATVGSLFGDMFTAQIGDPFNPSGTVQPFTYHGGKIPSWELSCDVDGVLIATLNCDFEDEDTSTGLATASYPSDFRVFSWVGGAITIGGSSVELTNFKLACDTPLKVDRRYLRGSALKKEPTEEGRRNITWEAEADFADLVQYDRYRAALITGTSAAIVATFDGPVFHAGATLPRLEITLPAAQFNKVKRNRSGVESTMQSLSGKAMIPTGGGSQATITYRTTDALP